MHVVLLGDSIFDNASYTKGRPAVIAQVRQLLPAGGRATLLAVDGATTEDVPSQIAGVPPDASHLVLSVGGNDVLRSSGFLYAPARSTDVAVAALSDVSRAFEEKYRRAVAACQSRPLPLTLCTIYNGRFPGCPVPALGLDRSHGLQRRYLEGWDRVQPLHDRLAICLFFACRLFQPDRTLLRRRRQDRSRDVNLVSARQNENNGAMVVTS
jgi:hypothetical protein